MTTRLKKCLPLKNLPTPSETEYLLKVPKCEIEVDTLLTRFPAKKKILLVLMQQIRSE